MASTSRHITLENHPMLAGDLVGFLLAVEARALGHAGVTGTLVDLKETRPDGTSAQHPHGELSMLERVCLIDGNTQVSVTWLVPDGRISLMLQGATQEKNRLGVVAFAPHAGQVNAVLDAFTSVFQAPTIRVARPLATRPPAPDGQAPGPRRGAFYKIAIPILGGIVAIAVWALTR